jgi:hypothetical protein
MSTCGNRIPSKGNGRAAEQKRGNTRERTAV